MSNSLVKASLSLFGDDFDGGSDGPKAKKRKKQKDPMSLIPSKKIGVKKELRKLNKNKNVSKKIHSQTKSLFGNKDSSHIDYTEKSVETIQRLSKVDSMDSSISKPVFAYYNKGKLRPKKVKQGQKHKKTKKKDKKEESSLFTDEDFEKFRKEYDFGELKKKFL
ncbi:hypothetical protein ACF0H5_001502 [Mactra antiquata]